MVTQDYLKEIFEYKDGSLYWKKSRPHVTLGMKAGHLKQDDGYIRIAIDKKAYYAHRLIYIFHHGFCPKTLDHIDTNRSNNKIENLRPATNSKNGANRKLGSNSKTGFKGVHQINECKFRAYISINKKRKHLGYFNTATDAHLAYQAAAKDAFGEFARFN
jgi:hypothetical protein